MLNELIIAANDLNFEIYGFIEHGFVRGFPVIYNGEDYVVRDVYRRSNPGDIGQDGRVQIEAVRLGISKKLTGENIWVFAGELKFCSTAVQRFVYQREWELDFMKRQLESIVKHSDEQQGE